MKGRCKYPGCRLRGRGTFALVPLCNDHLSDIWDEARNYYRRRISDRQMYDKIADQIPWSRKRLGEYDRNGEKRKEE